MNAKRIECLCLLLVGWTAWGETVDLLQRYPTKLTEQDVSGERARPWEFTGADIFHVSQFKLEVGKDLQVKTGPAELGIGHCADGAVWAVLIPGQGGELTSTVTNRAEPIAHVWLRFHPKEVTRLFPVGTVSGGGATNLVWQMQAVANTKMNASWQAGGRAMIPGPKDMTVDVDVKDGPRRFFVVDTGAQTAKYEPFFERRPMRQLPALTPELAGSAFDQLWEAFDRKYAMFAIRPEVDWAKLREQYRPRALASQSSYELAGVCAEMLKPLRDLHVWMTIGGSSVPVFNRPRRANANPQGCRAILRAVTQEQGEKGQVAWTVTTNRIGYLAIYGWNGASLVESCVEALEKMRDTRGLILDVRLNGGGDEPIAAKVAGRFLEKEFVYAYSQLRNGAGHTNLTEKYPRTVSPRGPWRYNRPVLLLIGEKCMSSNESFIGMMTGDPLVTTMGEHTCGSSGNPTIIRLPLEMTVSVPQWIDYLPDGTTPLDERGFQPQVPFGPAPGAFEGKRDDLLAAALARLSQVPLPDKPIAGPAYEPSVANLRDHSRAVAQEAKDSSRPRVVSVTPANDAVAVSPVTELRVRFDRPMSPLSLKLNWEAGGFLQCEFPHYNSNNFEFTIPVRLAPGALQQILVNEPLVGEDDISKQRLSWPREGFQSLEHKLAGLFVWRFRTQAKPASPEKPAPRVTVVTPTSGSETPFRTLLEIQFDQPMAPLEEAMPYLQVERGPKEVRLVSRLEYDAARHVFRLPLVLPPGEKAAFTLTGFRSVAGVAAKPIRLEYQVSGEEVGKAEQEKMEASVKDTRLLELLQTMKEKRSALTSVAERVQVLTLNQREGLYVELRSQAATFRWQQPGSYYADATEPMLSCREFRIGSDGERWWQRVESAHSTNFVACPAKEIEEKNVSICDPFGLTERTPEGAARELGLRYAGLYRADAAEDHLVEAWHLQPMPDMCPFGSLLQWRIDGRNYRPVELTGFHQGMVLRQRFLYDAVNEPLPAADFAVPQVKGAAPAAPEPLDADYTSRFVNLRDGSDGRMSVRWGKEGPKGRSSGGLN